MHWLQTVLILLVGASASNSLSVISFIFIKNSYLEEMILKSISSLPVLDDIIGL
jgi:hypothetical protein